MLMANQVHFPRGWADGVKEQILSDKSPSNFLRVAIHLRNADPEAYTPKFVSIGPYRTDKCDKEELKLKYAARFWQNVVNYTDDTRWDGIVHTIEMKLQDIARFYAVPVPSGEFGKNFAVMMTVDSFFILQFLTGYGRIENAMDIKCDILKLENQIPLFVLISVWKETLLSKRVVDDGQPQSFLIRKAYSKLSPFEILVDFDSPEGKEPPHLLSGFHTVVSRFLCISSAQQEKELYILGCMRLPAIVLPVATLLQIIRNFLQVHLVENLCRIFFLSTHERGSLPFNGYSASELARAGINFKSFTAPSHRIWFDKYSHTLYLPRMTVTNPLTEVFFSNLCALESNDDNLGDNVKSFVQLMACLINNPDDVGELKNSHVIRLENPFDNLVEIWKGMHQPFSSGRLELPKELQDALDDVLKKKCCMMKCRIVLSKLFQEYKEQYLSKPWKVVALLVGIFILLMNIIQAYCNLFEC